MFQYSQTVYTLKTLLSQNWFYFFFLIFWHSKIPSSSGTPRYKHYFFIYTMALRCPFPFSIFFTSLQNFFTSLHHLFYFPSPFVKFPFRVSFLLCQLFSFSSELSFTSLHHFLYLPSPFFYFPSEFFLLHFSIFKLILLSVSIFYFPSEPFYFPSDYSQLFLLTLSVFYYTNLQRFVFVFTFLQYFFTPLQLF